MSKKIKLLILGDVVGKAGRAVIHNVLPKLKEKYKERLEALLLFDKLPDKRHWKRHLKKTKKEMDHLEPKF